MKPSLDEILKDVPAVIRKSMIEDARNLAPGAAQVMARFWSAIHAGNGNSTTPRAEAYRAAATSESTFRCLLRALARYAPHVSTAHARPVSEEWYARRPKQQSPTPKVKKPAGSTWPVAWQQMKPALDAAPLKRSTRQRYMASIDRCAAIVAEGLASDQLGFISACDLSEAFLFHPDPTRRVKLITAANYINSLIALGTKARVGAASLKAMQFVWRDLKEQAALCEKNKYERLSGLMKRGGYAYVAEKIGELTQRAHQLPAHTASRRRCMQQAVVCALILNKPPRGGDMVSWRLDEQLVRAPDGTWSVKWEQEKTGVNTETGAIWPEIGDILDAWILDGRPGRLIHFRYQELIGRNWLTFDHGEPYRKLPTELTKTAIGVPSHDLRTLAADYMRRHDPAHAANVIATHLGHSTQAAGNAYRAECEGSAAQSIWADARKTIATQFAGSSSARKKLPDW